MKLLIYSRCKKIKKIFFKNKTSIWLFDSNLNIYMDYCICPFCKKIDINVIIYETVYCLETPML